MTNASVLIDERPIDSGKSHVHQIIMEVMREVYARLPYDQKFSLSDGSNAQIKKFSAPMERDGEYCFGFDVDIEGGKLDHLEFWVKQSGWGMTINPSEGSGQ